jgi:hypothetical protein
VKAWLIAVFGICLVALAATSELTSGQTAPDSLTIFPASLDFGDHTVGSQSQPATITIANPTQADIKLTEILLSGIDFSKQTNCGKSLAPGASCTVQVVFKPAISGQRIGNVAITGSDSGSPHFVAVVGTGK